MQSLSFRFDFISWLLILCRVGFDSLLRRRYERRSSPITTSWRGPTIIYNVTRGRRLVVVRIAISLTSLIRIATSLTNSVLVPIATSLTGLTLTRVTSSLTTPVNLIYSDIGLTALTNLGTILIDDNGTRTGVSSPS